MFVSSFGGGHVPNFQLPVASCRNAQGSYDGHGARGGVLAMLEVRDVLEVLQFSLSLFGGLVVWWLRRGFPCTFFKNQGFNSQTTNPNH